MLVQICGLPGSGKTTLAAAVADAVPVVALRVDAIEAAMRRYGVAAAQSGIAAYAVMHAVAGPHLRRGQVVVADAVSPTVAAREGWVGTAAAHGAALRVVEVVCPDPVEHRRRVETRPADLPGFALPTWDDVRRAAREYEPRHDERLVVDSTRPVADVLPEVLAYLGLAPGTARGAAPSADGGRL